MDPLFVFPSAASQLIMEKRMAVIANNIANVSTSGFRKDLPVFATITAPISTANSMGGSQDGTGGTSRVPVPSFAVIDQMITNFSEGPIRTTDAPLDIAIEGKGFFQIQTPGGIRYTRNGSFTLSNEGKIVTQNGNPLLGVGGPITLPAGIINIDDNGKISVKGPGIGPSTEVDLIALVDVADTTRLQKSGDNLFELLNGQATPFESGQARVRQGALEGSNVNPVEEMIAMITAVRQYEAAQKAMQTADDMDTKNINKVGQLEG